jgi:hypothetical protein
VNPDTFAEPIAALRRSTSLIADNLSYIQKELPTLEVPESLRDEIVSACQKFEGALWDVNAEIRNLEENADPAVTIGLIGRWMRAEIETLHQLVTELRKASAEDVSRMGLEVLVTESAANILYAYRDLCDALNSISAGLG